MQVQDLSLNKSVSLLLLFKMGHKCIKRGGDNLRKINSLKIISQLKVQLSSTNVNHSWLPPTQMVLCPQDFAASFFLGKTLLLLLTGVSYREYTTHLSEQLTLATSLFPGHRFSIWVCSWIQPLTCKQWKGICTVKSIVSAAPVP